MKGRKDQPSLQDLRNYYKRQQSRNILKKSCIFLKEKKKLTASGSQKEDEQPQNDLLGPTFGKGNYNQPPQLAGSKIRSL